MIQQTQYFLLTVHVVGNYTLGFKPCCLLIPIYFAATLLRSFLYPKLPKNHLLDHSVSLKEAVELSVFINLLNFCIWLKSAFNVYAGCEAVHVVAWHTFAMKWRIQKGECCYVTWQVISHQWSKIDQSPSQGCKSSLLAKIYLFFWNLYCTIYTTQWKCSLKSHGPVLLMWSLWLWVE